MKSSQFQQGAVEWKTNSQSSPYCDPGLNNKRGMCSALLCRLLPTGGGHVNRVIEFIMNRKRRPQNESMQRQENIQDKILNA